jgi:hypothetical protein
MEKVGGGLTVICVVAEPLAILMLAIPTLVKNAGPEVVVTTADPGFVGTQVTRDQTGLYGLMVKYVAVLRVV